MSDTRGGLEVATPADRGGKPGAEGAHRDPGQREEPLPGEAAGSQGREAERIPGNLAISNEALRGISY